MAKFWIQYDAASGTYVPWEANTPPSPESIHRARFLSQFAAWIKYLSAMEGTEPDLNFPCWNWECSGVDHSFIYPARPGDTGENRHIGTVIQTAAFWNMLNWTPGDAWLDISEEQLVAGTTIDDGTAKLVESDSYAATEFDDIQAGDIIHPTSNPAGNIRQLLWKLRKRIDLCCTLNRGFDDIKSDNFYKNGSSYFPDNEQFFNSSSDPNRVGIGCTALYARWFDSFGGVKYRVSERPYGLHAMPNSGENHDKIKCSLVFYTDNAFILYGTNTYTYENPYGDGVILPRVTITDALAYPSESGKVYSSKTWPSALLDYISSGYRAIAYYHNSWNHPLDTPHLDYLPLNSRFNDESAFSDLYNPA